ncbi:cytochrome c biogenesis protein CcsA [Nocardioides sp. W3-2-3]|nr:cytochrome c biogenesis protein CcsA [Nocardioides convexus]
MCRPAGGLVHSGRVPPPRRRRSDSRPRRGAGAVGQHVRVHHHRQCRRRRDLPGVVAVPARTVARPSDHGSLGDHAHAGRASSRRTRRPARARAPVVLALRPRHRRSPGDRRIHRGGARLDPVHRPEPSRGQGNNGTRPQRPPPRYRDNRHLRLPGSTPSDSPVWTFAALIAGPIWARFAWGRYWGWDPKEVWAFVTWVAYAAYLHARATAGWRGQRAAILALIGFAALWFNFIGVNFFISGLHSYAGK